MLKQYIYIQSDPLMDNLDDDAPRFELYVKKSSIDGGPRGSCPFSQKAYMFLTIVTEESEREAHPVDIINKPFYMMKLNPAGTVPILVDHGENDKVITESAAIVIYLNDICKPKYNMFVNVKCEANEVISLVFPKLHQYLKNTDPSKDSDCRAALCQELQKVEDYLKSNGTKYLLGDKLTEPDLNFLPKFFQVICAAEYFCNFKCLDRFPELKAYYERAQEEDVWKKTSTTYQDIVNGYLEHGVTKRK